MSKACPLCGLLKSADAFSLDRSKKSGLASRCRDCNKEAMKAWAKANPTRRSDWAKANPVKNCEAKRRDYAKNKEKRVRDTCNWQRRNSGYVAARHREFYGAQRETLADGYVRRVLAQTSEIPRAEIPQALVDLKREQLRLSRLAKSIKREATNQLKDKKL